MKKNYPKLEMDLVHFDIGTEVHTCDDVGICVEVACRELNCRTDGIAVCRCDNDIIHASGE